jgi:hypothetical protein
MGFPYHHIWEELPRRTLDVGLARASRETLDCGQNLYNLSTNYPQTQVININFHISAEPKPYPQIWG